MEGSCSIGQSPQWAVVPVEGEVCGVDLRGSERRQANIEISKRVQKNPKNFLFNWDILIKKGLYSVELAIN
jgi:hypothetical protein